MSSKFRLYKYATMQHPLKVFSQSKARKAITARPIFWEFSGIWAFETAMDSNKDKYLVIPVEEREMENRNSDSESTDRDYEFEMKFDKDFWLKVMHN